MERGAFSLQQRITTVKAAAKPQANVKAQDAEARPTITLQSVVLNGPNTASFSGWGPNVTGVGTILKNWN